MDREIELSLVRRLGEGDTAAFDTIYEELHVRLLTFLVRLCRSRDVADDLAEETWLRLVGHAHRLRPDTRLLPWLFTVARNLHVSYRRSRFLEDNCTESLIGLWPGGSPQASPFEETAASALVRRVPQPAPCRVSPLESVLVAGFCLAYLFVVIQQALH